MGQKIAVADATLNVAEAVEICGPINPRIFQQALRQLVCEAETLRVRLIEHEGKPRQVVRPVYEGEFPYIDVSGGINPSTAAENWMMEDVMRPLDLANDPLWFAALFKVADDRYLWYQRGHHVVYDGYSAGMIARRLAELYSGYVAGRDPTACEFGSLQALVEAEATYRDSDRLHRDRAFWKEQLAHLPEAVTLAHGGRRPSMGGLRRSIGYLSRETTWRLHELGKQTAASLPQVLIGLIAVYYHRATGSSDLVFGMPVSGRINAALHRSPGMVANVVAIRLSFTPRMTAAELFTQVARVVRQSLRHQQYRYEDLRRDLGLVNQSQQIAWLGVNIEPFDYKLSFAGADAIGHNLSNGSAEDLTVFVYDRGNNSGLRFDLDANPALYSMAELDEHRRRLMLVIESVLASPKQPLRQIDILGEMERRRLLFDWNDTTAPVSTLSLPAMIGRQAGLTPKAVAVVFQDTVLSYEELNERSVHEARRLVANGIKPGDIVAVALPRSEQLVVTLLAIMRSGAAYLPLDPDEPPERIAMMLDDASPVALITLPVNGRFSYTGLLLAPENLDASLAVTPHEPDLAAPERTVYVLYTSGSTGRPKGVEITHRNLGNFLQGMRRQLAPTASDRFLAVTTVTFDIAGLELFLPLTVGARVVIAGGEAVRNPPVLARLIQASGATHMQATPSLWRVLLASPEARLDGVHALVGGEALSGELAGRLQRRAARVTQFYGPTETTVWSTAFELNTIGAEPPPIGRPIINTRLYVLDEYTQPVPTGAVGELYIGGAGVARGYLNRPELTEERFPPDPFTNNGNRMYRTGDLVRWNADALLEFVARADNQLKILGHRVEPGEIESILVQHAAIAEAVVSGHLEADGSVMLAAYLVAAKDCKIE
ncbi:MAG: amino acid adenylation domain-containing protein, partial [Candidatus Binataceae bacterium]